MNDEEKNKGTVTPPPSGETTENANKDTPVTEEKPDVTKDIDFKKVADELEKQTPPAKTSKYTPAEKAKRDLHFVAEKAKELGVDPAEVLGFTAKAAREEVDTTNFVTKLDLAREEARRLAKTDDGTRAVMWYVEHKGLSVEDAWFLVNKPRFQNTFAEIQRGSIKPPEGAGESAGQKPKTNISPDRHPDHDVLTRRGYKLVSKGLYQAVTYQQRFDEASKAWVQERIPKK